jgi:ketosteroid isomerase-like protein
MSSGFSASIVRRSVVLLLLLLGAWSGLAQEAAAEPIASVTLPPELDRVLRDYERAWQAKDAEALSRLFTKDGFVLSNGKPPVRGTEAIRNAYAGMGGPLALRAFEYAVDGAVGYIIGGYAESPKAADSGKFILALRKVDRGRWLIAADIDNTNRRSRSAP